ncbi:MAG: lysophospholipid acyltransferase family protein [Candidatus Aminicenantes bacterium]|nr:lysophospholipid acyltransferase family protein [Candidatus Aminicenantes bacterium]
MGDWLRRKCIRLLIHAIAGTCRTEVSGREAVEEVRRQGAPLIILFWHRHIFALIHHFRNSGARPLISHSKDGDLVAGVAREFGLDPIRGSSSRGGAAAFLTMMRSLREPGTEVLITADGPRGPARKMKPGTLELARRSGAWLIPVSWYARPVHIFRRSWDKFLLPLPFSRVRLTYGAPIPPDALSSRHAEEMIRNRLNELEAGLLHGLRRKRDSKESI